MSQNGADDKVGTHKSRLAQAYDSRARYSYPSGAARAQVAHAYTQKGQKSQHKAQASTGTKITLVALDCLFLGK